MDKNEPYFFNPDLSSEQLEDWLNQQRLYVAHYNQLKSEKAALVKQLSEVDTALEYYANLVTPGELSFPWDPSPLLRTHQK
ncbi:hypothetical protein SMKC034_12360 [Serratia marcescens]|nr:hypothetical protein SMKC034_12360 [Serratia marcescens]